MPLYVIATPLGNLEDLSPRALELLKQAELILAEDTKKTRTLLASYGLSKQLLRCDSYQEAQLAANTKFISQLKSDTNLALVSDAGSPTIADPGATIVALAHQCGIRVVPVPGPSAVIAALSISGFSAANFIFGGYLSHNSNERIKTIQQLRDAGRTLVFYETPHRILASLQELCQHWGKQRQALLARELTKQHETLYYGSLAKITASLTAAQAKDAIKGEMVLVLQGMKPAAASEKLTSKEHNMLKLILNELPLKKAASLAAQLSGKSKRVFYAAGLKLQDIG